MIDLTDVRMIIGLYILGVNLLGLIVFFTDKQKAKRQSWRTPEATLFTVAIFGGSLGCLLGMYMFRHKTKKPLFFIGIPAILIIQIVLILLLIYVSPYELKIM